MAWRLFFSNLKNPPKTTLQSLSSSSSSSSSSSATPIRNPNLPQTPPTPKTQLSPISSPFPSPLPINRKPNSPLTSKQRKKKLSKNKKKNSPRSNPINHQSKPIHHFEKLVERDAFFRFLTRTKDFLSRRPDHILLLDEAGKLHRELGFPRGRKVARFVERHPSLLQLYRHSDGKVWLGFTDLMENLLVEEQTIFDSNFDSRVSTIRKLLMISAQRRIPLSKIHHCRHLFGIPNDIRDRVLDYPDYFRVVVEGDGKRILELVEWDPALAVSSLEREFIADEDGAKRSFKFKLAHGKDLNLDEDDERRLNLLNTLPLVSPYSDGSELKPWSLEAEKYRVGVLHEFLSLTLEMRASIHHIVEFKEEFNLTKHTYQMLVKQPRAFHLAGTEMNWTVFLRDGYGDDGVLKEKDPQVVFNERLYRYATMKGTELELEMQD
ncbi:hypothetical protein AAC387_Pa04g2918 [Persea americana]